MAGQENGRYLVRQRGSDRRLQQRTLRERSPDRVTSDSAVKHSFARLGSVHNEIGACGDFRHRFVRAQ